MKLRSRILLVVTGLLIFALFAPTLLFYARGFRYDLDTGRIVKTGTIVVRTQPRGASVTVDGQQLTDLTPTTERFVIPGEYLVEIRKDGYLPWQKRITVHEQQVAYVPPEREHLVLLPESGAPIVIATTTLDVYLAGNILFALHGEQGNGSEAFSLEQISIPDLQRSNLRASLASPFTHPRIAAADRSGDGQWAILLSDQGRFWYLSAQSFKALPPGFSQISFAENQEQVVALSGKGELVLYDVITPAEQVLASQVRAFTIAGDRIYAINAKRELIEIDRSIQQSRILMDGLPNFSSAQIIGTPDKQVFLLLDENLYYVAEHLELVNQGVRFAESQNRGGGILYGNNNEIWFFDPLGKKSNQLITRTSKLVLGAALSPALGYAFVAEGEALNAVELEWAGQSNIYTLHRPSDAISRLFLSPDEDILLILENSQLKYLKMR